MNITKSNFRYPATITGLLILLILTILAGCKKEEPERVTKIETTSISNIDYFSTTAEGTLLDIGDNGVEQHGFCWSLDPNPEYTATSIQLGPRTSIGKFSSTLTGLDPGFTYYVRAYAFNSEGTIYGNELSFTTKYDAPTASIITSPANTSHGTSFSASVSGQNISTKGIYYSENPMPDETDLILNKGDGAGDFVCDISGLKSEITYYLRPFASDQHTTIIGDQLVISTSPMIFDVKVTPYEMYNEAGPDSGSQEQQHEICGNINTWINDNVAAKVNLANWYNSFSLDRLNWIVIESHTQPYTLQNLSRSDRIGFDFDLDDYDPYPNTNDWLATGSDHTLMSTILDLDNNDPTVQYSGTYIIPREEAVDGGHILLIMKYEFTEK